MTDKRRATALIFCILLHAAIATAIFAQPIGIDLDPSKTKIGFTLSDVLHTVHGTFKLKSGHIDVNPESKAISGQVVVDAASGESGSGARDSRMNKNILETDRYPEITFSPTAIQGDILATSSSVTVIGWFAIHGQRHQLSIPMQVRMSGGEAVATGKFVVPYVAWGMKNPSTFLIHVNQQVDIDLTVAGSIAPGSGKAPAF